MKKDPMKKIPISENQGADDELSQEEHYSLYPGDIVYQPENVSTGKDNTPKWRPVACVITRISTADGTAKLFTTRVIKEVGFRKGFKQIEVHISNPMSKECAKVVCSTLNRDIKTFLKNLNSQNTK
jgi:hypothetical protein